MRILFFDIDTLRPDHLGCYGYHRNTSPNIDGIAQDGIRFNNYFCSDAPCLPSRAALISGRFGIHNGVAGHGGTAADMILEGHDRGFQSEFSHHNLFKIFQRACFNTSSISTFAERHSAWWFNAGFNEMHNVGKCGLESAEEIMPIALEWLDKNINKDNWVLHLNFWDPHKPYRSPVEFGNPFENDPLPDWLNENVLEEHKKHIGPNNVNELNMYDDTENRCYPRNPGKATDMTGIRKIFDGYDCGINYTDKKIGEIVKLIKDAGIYDDTAIIITSDHGENFGELGIYTEHGTADRATCRIPMIIKWPGCQKKHEDDELHYNSDLVPTLCDLFGIEKWKKYDGKSYLKTLKDGERCGRDYIVLSQCAHVCQRSVIFDHYLYIKTYHDGYHLFPKEMLFDLVGDKYEQHNIASENPEICDKAAGLYSEWYDDMMLSSENTIDPLFTVINEGGPFHARGYLESYCRRLENTGRTEGAKRLKEKHMRQGGFV